MCRQCVREAFVKRGDGAAVLEEGAFWANFSGCASCGSLVLATARRSVTEDDDGEEETRYDHVCGDCDHVVAQHAHAYATDATTRRWSHECCLCGLAADERHSFHVLVQRRHDDSAARPPTTTTKTVPAFSAKEWPASIAAKMRPNQVADHNPDDDDDDWA